MIRPVLTYPDPCLRKVCDPLPGVDGATRKLIDDMIETMRAARGIGLAAPQIGVTRRLFVMDMTDAGTSVTPAPLALVNPEIVESSKETRTRTEGCLSIPDFCLGVTRPASVWVRYLDRKGIARERSFEGLSAACVQHEIDHLNGRLLIDRAPDTSAD